MSQKKLLQKIRKQLLKKSSEKSNKNPRNNCCRNSGTNPMKNFWETPKEEPEGIAKPQEKLENKFHNI